MQTIIANAANGMYHQVHPNDMPPKPWGPDWSGVLRAIFQERLTNTGVLDDIRMSDDAILHVDLKAEATDEQRRNFFEALLDTLYELGLHDRNQGVEYCQLEPGTGETNA